MDRPDVARTDVRGTSPADLMAARMSWEPQVAMIAAAAAAEQDFEEMHRCLEGGDRSDGFDE
jgi:DNA-binding FadR family transcriptional regulator